MIHSEYPERRYAWLVVVILLATAVLSYTDRQVLSLLVDPIRASLNVNDSQVSVLLGTAFAVVYAAAGIPLGWIADRFSRRNLILCGVALWSAGTLACGACHSYGGMLASRAVVGLGEAALSPAAISLIRDYFPPDKRGTAVAAFLSGIAMGSGAGILIGGGVLHLIENGAFHGTALAALPPWRTVLFVIGAPGLLWALLLLIIREPARQVTEQLGSNPRGARSWAMWAAVAPLCTVLLAESFADAAVGAWVPTLLIREFHHDPASVGLQLGLLLTGGFGAGVLLGGALADRAGAWNAKLHICGAAALLVLPLALAMTSGSFPLVMSAVGVYFVLAGINAATATSALLDIIPARSVGLIMSVSFCLNAAFGAGLGPSAVAFGARLFTSSTGLAVSIAACVSSGWAVSLLSVAVAPRAMRFMRTATAGN